MVDSRLKLYSIEEDKNGGEQTYAPICNQTSTKSAVLESFIGQFYQTRKPAKEIIINVPIQNSEVIINSLKKLYDIKTKFVIPKRGSKAQILRDLLPTE
ncbi:hypothetical protein [Rickettsia endosymbiont of Pantilius tunicatus]|uniref:hypothetical protein n=1 Tax=Rickettsia endosymbiont of Pantilius tunicatus TaxID=3066267 RepID=UPI00376EFA02